jgi:hypothetical protein
LLRRNAKVLPRERCAAGQLGVTDLDVVQEPVGDGGVVHAPEDILEGLEALDVALHLFGWLERQEELRCVARVLGGDAHPVALLGRSARQPLAALQQLLVTTTQGLPRALLERLLERGAGGLIEGVAPARTLSQLSRASISRE